MLLSLRLNVEVIKKSILDKMGKILFPWKKWGHGKPFEEFVKTLPYNMSLERDWNVESRTTLANNFGVSMLKLWQKQISNPHSHFEGFFPLYLILTHHL